MIHILVVDDDAALNQSICTYLNDSGYEAKGCLSAESAYDAMYNSLYIQWKISLEIGDSQGSSSVNCIMGFTKSRRHKVGADRSIIATMPREGLGNEPGIHREGGRRSAQDHPPADPKNDSIR